MIWPFKKREPKIVRDEVLERAAEAMFPGSKTTITEDYNGVRRVKIDGPYCVLEGSLESIIDACWAMNFEKWRPK